MKWWANFNIFSRVDIIWKYNRLQIFQLFGWAQYAEHIFPFKLLRTLYRCLYCHTNKKMARDEMGRVCENVSVFESVDDSLERIFLKNHCSNHHTYNFTQIARVIFSYYSVWRTFQNVPIFAGAYIYIQRHWNTLENGHARLLRFLIHYFPFCFVFSPYIFWRFSLSPHACLVTYCFERSPFHPHIALFTSSSDVICHFFPSISLHFNIMRSPHILHKMCCMNEERATTTTAKILLKTDSKSIIQLLGITVPSSV